MDKNGIGTDATIHEHIKTVQSRNYAIKCGNDFKPTPVGLSLVEVYQAIDIKLYKPYLRAQMEKEMNMIAEGKKSKDEVLSDAIREMQKIFNQVVSLREKMVSVLTSKYTKFVGDTGLGIKKTNYNDTGKSNVKVFVNLLLIFQLLNHL